jgi:hypothetical protein
MTDSVVSRFDLFASLYALAALLQGRANFFMDGTAPAHLSLFRNSSAHTSTSSHKNSWISLKYRSATHLSNSLKSFFVTVSFSLTQMIAPWGCL